MAARVQLQHLTSFVGGLNLRADAFELADDESPDLLNVDIDPRGGFYNRQGWTRMNSTAIQLGASDWDPRALFVHELGNGTDVLYLASDGRIGSSTDGSTWTKLTAGGTDIVAAATPHGADFAPWGDTLYIACGATGNDASVRVRAGTVTRMTQAEGANFSNDYSNPSSNTMPWCEFVASHHGYLFAAYTEESGTKYPHRIRWSHPNNPEAWHADDFHDIAEGGGPITGLMPLGDHLLIFKQSAVWAVFGYDHDSWQIVNVARDRGAVHRQAIAHAEHAVFFYSHPEGVFVIEGQETPKEISRALRPAFQSTDFNRSASNNIWLGWVGQRLWFSVPYSKLGLVGDAATVFVWDPSIGDGAWVAYQGAGRCAVGPFAQGGFGGGAGLRVAAVRQLPSLVRLDDNSLPLDDLDPDAADPSGFESYYVTRWVHGGYPTIKKRWRRPDFIVKERSAEYQLVVQSYVDFDELTEKRTKAITVGSSATGGRWGDGGLWGDGSIWNKGSGGSVVTRTSSFGPARALSVRVTGPEGLAWGVDGIVFKYQMRRIR